jgi:nucleotide-binding universal stress UspA family protein
MVKVLIPITDPESGERAVKRLLRDGRGPGLEVELLAIVEPQTSGRVRMILSQQRAESLVRAAANRWLERLGALLTASGIPYRAEVAVGPANAAIEAAARRADIDRVLLPASTPRWLSSATAHWHGARLARQTHHPVTVVS